MRTPAQQQRQKEEYREHGKYAKVNPCYVCGKSAGVDYCSHPDTDKTIDDELLCLCKKCGEKLSKYDGKTAIKIAFGDITKEDMVAPQGRCEKCGKPLKAEIEGSDADGNRGQWVYYCTNRNCEDNNQ